MKQMLRDINWHEIDWDGIASGVVLTALMLGCPFLPSPF